MTTNLTLKSAHDIRYLTNGHAHGGNAGAMAYYTASGEPAGRWAGVGALALGLAGAVDAEVIERLYMLGVGPNGEQLLRKRPAKDEVKIVAAYVARHPFASASEIAAARAQARGGAQTRVPYYDVTISAAKSVSVLHASLKIAAKEARDNGHEDQAAQLDAEADAIEADLEASARFAVERFETEATYTRTGHHSSTTGEWRDGLGLVAATFVHHISRDGDPQLHVHIAIANMVQRGGPTGPLAPPPRRARLRSRCGGAYAGRLARRTPGLGPPGLKPVSSAQARRPCSRCQIVRCRAEPVKAVCDRRATAPAELPGERTREDDLDRTSPAQEVVAIGTRDMSGQEFRRREVNPGEHDRRRMGEASWAIGCCTASAGS